MTQTLYIAPNEHKQTGCIILDEQHHGIAATINSLHYFIQKGYGLDALKPTLRILNEYLTFHLKTEEMLLADHDYELSKEEQKQRNSTRIKFQKIALEATAHREPDLMLRFCKSWWLQHLKDHQAIYDHYLINK
jgi:hemerythrin